MPGSHLAAEVPGKSTFNFVRCSEGYRRIPSASAGFQANTELRAVKNSEFVLIFKQKQTNEEEEDKERVKQAHKRRRSPAAAGGDGPGGAGPSPQPARSRSPGRRHLGAASAPPLRAPGSHLGARGGLGFRKINSL